MRALAITLAAATSAATCLTAVSAHAGPSTGVCAGETHCRVVAHDDVDGDGHNDAIGLQRDGKHHIVVLVLTHGGTLLSHRIAMGGRPANRWAGSAAIDNAAGHELVLLTHAGSRVRGYTVVRYHNGTLHTEASPDGDKRWTIAHSATALLGWHQYFGDLGGYHMIRTSSVGKANGTYATSRTIYAWRDGAWVLLGPGSTVFEPNRKAAVHRSGFHITGLGQFPPS